jgi:hypothetical protein
MADKKVVAPLVDHEPEEEEEYYAQYVFENCTFNITMAENSQLNIGTGKPAPFPPPKG